MTGNESLVRRSIVVGVGMAVVMSVFFYLRTRLLWTIPFGVVWGAFGGWVTWRILLREERHRGRGPDP